MRGGIAVATLAAALVGVPALPASAVEGCPAGVEDVRGDQPTHAQVEAWIVAAAAEHQVPASLLRVIAYKESTWRQYTAATNAPPVLSNDGACSIGLMQVTPTAEWDPLKLAAEPQYNVRAGAATLRAKWDLNQQSTNPPDGYGPDDPDVIENWYWALCAYNGCPPPYSTTYNDSAADLLREPFMRLPDTTALRAYLTPAGFTTPKQADGTYAFPEAFQARWTETGGEFVFYDEASGDVEKVVPARVHRVSAPPVPSYPAQSWGPDGPRVLCVDCQWWRLAEGSGLRGRAHWTNSITGPTSQARVTWAPGVTGRYRVDAYVPALGTETLGKATYTVTDGTTATTATVDQNARKGGWVTLAQRSFSGPASVTLGDTSDVAGVKLVADAVRVVPEPSLTLQRVTPETTTYGNSVRLYLTLRYPNGDPLRYRYVTLHRRALGTTSWQQVATLRTSDMGAAGTTVKAERNVEYTARYTPSPGEYLTSAASGNVRVLVAPRVAMSFSDNTVLTGVATTLRTSVSPAHGGHTVAVQRYYSGAWRPVKYLRLDAYGRAAWTFSMTNSTTACGAYQRHAFRVVKSADHDHTTAVSATAYLYVYRHC